jgi:branched-chain amino acid aminotransferase
MYVRPTGIATYGALGVGTAKSAKVFTITCPVGPYYPEGFAPVSLLAETKFVRAWPGGVGNSKLGSYVLD